LSQTATTVTKVCRILTEFKGQSSLGVTQIAHRTGLLPSDVHRLLHSLRVYGYIEQNPHTRKYSIGSELLSLRPRSR
jgi:DNA-binding IclR family transcriptional regulator